jgi:membrane protein
MKAVWTLIRDAAKDWSDDHAARLAAALAFYALLSLAPLLMLAVSVAGLVFGDEAARGGIADQLTGLVGPQGAETIETILASARSGSAGVLGTVFGTLVLLFGASGVFGELQGALNVVWEVEPKPGRGIKGILRDRFASFAAVMGVAFLLLVSLVLGAALAAFGAFLSGALPGGAWLWQAVNFVISLGVTTCLFALVFKLVPDAKVAWADVWIGAAVTAILFELGKLAIGLYLGRSGVSSAFGAAGSVVVIVIWIYYSAQILLFGAELTQVYARQFGSGIRPDANAVAVPDAEAGTAPAASR